MTKDCFPIFSKFSQIIVDTENGKNFRGTAIFNNI